MPPKYRSSPEVLVAPVHYRFQGQDHLSLTIYAGFSLLESERLVLPAEGLKGALESLAPYESHGLGLDLGLPKKRGEFLAAGAAFAPYGSKEKALAVSFSVGSLRRDFLVIGPRESLGSLPGPAAPFAANPLDWSHTAFHEELNPLGLKPGGQVASNGPSLFGPLVMEASFDRHGQLTASPTLSDHPVSPLPRPLANGAMTGLGSFGQDWLLTAFPGLPDDFNWSFFNLAQKEQRLSQGYFKGDEIVRVTNAHAHYPLMEVRLPGLIPTVLVQGSTGTKLLTVRPDLDTIWLFPSYAIGLLLWRVQLTVQDELASDLQTIAIGLEKMGSKSVDSLVFWEKAADGIWPLAPLASVIPLDPDAPAPRVLPTEPLDAAKALDPPLTPEPVTLPSWPAPLPAVSKPVPVIAVPLAALAQPILAPKEAAAAIMADSRKLLAEELPTINSLFREYNLPEVTLASFEPHLEQEEKNLTEALTRSQNAPGPLSADEDLAASLKTAGYSPERIQATLKAVDLPLPKASAFPNPALWEAALSDYGRKWAGLLGLPASLGLEKAKAFKAAATLNANPGDSGALASLMGLNSVNLEANLPSPTRLLDPGAQEKAEFTEALQGLGLEPEKGEKLFHNLTSLEEKFALNEAPTLAAQEKLTLAMGQELEAAFSLPPGSLGASIQKNYLTIRKSFYGSPELGASLTALAAVIPGLKQSLSLIDEIRLDPKLPHKSLTAIAQKAGIMDPKILKRVSELDILNPISEISKTPEPPTEALLMDQESIVPPRDPVFTPQPSQFFQSRNEVVLTLETPSFRNLPHWGQIFVGAILTGINLDGLDFSGLDLSGADFSETSLNGANLTGVNGQGASFAGANFNGAILTGAIFTQGLFTRAIIQNQDLSSVGLTGSDFTEADLTGSILDRVVANGADFSGALLSGRFRGASLIQARFADQNLDKADFSGALLDGAVLTAVSLNQADFSAASLFETAFSQVKAHRTDFRAIRGHGIRFLLDSDLTKASFREATLFGASFQGTVLVGVDFRGSRAPGLEAAFLDLSQASFVGAYLREASFFGATLRGADFAGADLLRAKLGSADLRGGSFSGASLYGADLYRVRVDDQTSFLGADLNDTCLKIASFGLKAV